MNRIRMDILWLIIVFLLVFLILYDMTQMVPIKDNVLTLSLLTILLIIMSTHLFVHSRKMYYYFGGWFSCRS